jgi:hypothetical protein
MTDTGGDDTLRVELVRRAVLRSAIAGRERSDGDLMAACDVLQADGAVLTRSLLGSRTVRP